MDEIKALIKYTPEYREYEIEKFRRGEFKFDLDPIGLESNNPESIKYYEKRGYKEYINNRLESFGLVDTGLDERLKKLSEIGNSFLSSEFEVDSTPKIKLTKFGKGFIRFFKLKYEEDLVR